MINYYQNLKIWQEITYIVLDERGDKNNLIELLNCVQGILNYYKLLQKEKDKLKLVYIDEYNNHLKENIDLKIENSR